MSATIFGVALACLASGLFNAGIALQAVEARATSSRQGLRPSLLVTLMRRRRWLGGIALGGAALLLQTGALLLAPVTVVQPADAAGLLLLLFLGSRYLHEPVGRRELLAVGAIVVGICVLTATAPRHLVSTGSPDVGDLAPVAVVILAATSPYVLRRWLGTRSLVVVLGAGFAFALSAFMLKLIADALSDERWLELAIAGGVAGAGALLGTLSEQTALQRRAASQVAPIIFVVELLVPVALAVLVVGEDWGGGGPAIVAALALVSAGVIALARAPLVSGMIGAAERELGEPRGGRRDPVDAERTPAKA